MFGAKDETPLRADIEAAVLRMGYKVGTDAAIRSLESRLNPAETVHELAFLSAMPVNGLLVVTSERVLVCGGLGAKKQLSLPLERITRVQAVTPLLGLEYGSLIVDTLDGARRFKIRRLRRFKEAILAAQAAAQ